MECMKICVAGLALLVAAAAGPGVRAAPQYPVPRPQDKRSVADPDAGVQRLAGHDGFGYFGLGGGGQPAPYYDAGVVPLPFVAAAGFGDVPAAPHFDPTFAAAAAGLAAFQYPAFGFDVGYPFSAPPPVRPETPTAAGDARPRPAAEQDQRSGGRALPAAADANPADHSSDTQPQPQHQQQQQQQQQQVPDLVLELRPPPYSAPSENAYAEPPSAGAAPAGDAARGGAPPADYESVPSVSYSLPAPQAGKSTVIVVPDGRPSADPGPAHSNRLSANSYGESNSVLPDPYRADGAGGGPKVVVPVDADVASNTVSAGGKREQPAVRYAQQSSRDDDDGGRDDRDPSGVTPRD